MEFSRQHGLNDNPADHSSVLELVLLVGSMSVMRIMAERLGHLDFREFPVAAPHSTSSRTFHMIVHQALGKA